MFTMINIRASMLPAYTDCPRRAAAKQWKQIIIDMGFVLRETPLSIGGAVGTSCHEASKCMVQCKMQGERHDRNDVIDAALSSLHTETAGGVSMDETTGTMNDAEKQVLFLSSAFESDVLPLVNAVELEYRSTARISEDAELSGRFDLEDADETIDDWKYGSKLRYYGSQLGGYSILRKSRMGKSPKRLSIYHLPRFPVKKTYPGTSRYFYEVEACERAAYYTTMRIKADIERFIKTSNPWCFPANPMSVLCSDKYCPARGTSFCDVAA
jgi:hypothetical protein